MNLYKQRAIYMAGDFATTSCVWLLFNLLRFHETAHMEGFTTLSNFLLSPTVAVGQFFVPIFWILLHALSGYYNKPYGKSRLGELFSTLVSTLTGVLILFFVVVLNSLPPSFSVYYEFFFTLLGLQFFLTYSVRLFITQRGLTKIARREWTQRVLLIGSDKQKQKELTKGLEDMGYTVACCLQKVDMEELPTLLEEQKIDLFVLAMQAMPDEKQLSILYSLYRFKRPIKVLADKSNLLSKVNIKTIRGIPLVDVTESNLSAAENNVKWVFDKVVSFLFLTLFSPLYLYLIYRVRRDSLGPIFYKQERIGRGGKPFCIYKFRTMYKDAESEGCPLLTEEQDERITPYGKVMRKYRLDELPQFWNVLKGDMSLVGPRPERKYYIDQIIKKAPYYYLLHNVRPGITSLGMVKYGYANSVEKMVERMEYDVLYYENMSLSLDLTILIYTVTTVITGKGI